MSDTVNRINTFFKLASEHRVWLITTSLASVALAYTWQFMLAAPAQYAARERKAVDLRDWEFEHERLQLISEKLQTSSEQLKELKSVRAQLTSSLLEAQIVDNRELAKRALVLKLTVATEYAQTSGLLSGSRFENEQLELYRKDLHTILEEVESRDDAFVEFYILRSRSDDIANEMANETLLKIPVKEIVRLEGALIEAANNFESAARSLAEKHAVDVGEEANIGRVLTIRFWLAVIAMVYVLAFLVGVIIAFRRWLMRKVPARIVLPSGSEHDDNRNGA